MSDGPTAVLESCVSHQGVHHIYLYLWGVISQKMIHDLFAVYWNNNKKHCKIQPVNFRVCSQDWDVYKSMNCPHRYINTCAYACVLACECLPLLSCCLFIIDAVLATSIFANYPSTRIQARTNTKSTKKQDIALAEKRQDKQHPTSKFGTLFFVSTSTSPYQPSYLCLFSSSPFSSAHTSCLFLYFFILSLLCPSHHTCFLPFAPSLYPSSCPSLPPTSYSPVTPFILVLILLPSWMFLSNIYQQALTVSNLLETLSEITAFLCLHTTKKDSRELRRVIHSLWR